MKKNIGGGGFRVRPGAGRIAMLILAFGASTAGIAFARSEGTTTPEWTTFRDVANRLTVDIPSGWHRSHHRLVPKLLNPREILSLGNFPMQVGGGGVCGRYPEAAIKSMKPGDVLISIQETGVSHHSNWKRSMPTWPRRIQLSDLTRDFRPSRTGPPRLGKTWSENLRVGRRALWVFVAFGESSPSPAQRHQVERILDRLDFG